MINKIMHIYSTLKLNLCDLINMIDLLQNNMKHFVGIRYIYNTLKLNLRDSINMIDLLQNNMKHFVGIRYICPTDGVGDDERSGMLARAKRTSRRRTAICVG